MISLVSGLTRAKASMPSRQGLIFMLIGSVAVVGAILPGSPGKSQTLSGIELTGIDVGSLSGVTVVFSCDSPLSACTVDTDPG